jgi:DNA-binding response OmpR family regulator
MPGKILMIEDESGLVLTVGDRLVADGYKFESCMNGTEGEALARTGTFDLLILDVMLPGKDGFAICKSLRDSGIKVPILMLTARSSTDDRVSGLKIGADDYLCKPFEMAELEARIEALLRRTDAVTQGNENGIAGKELTIDLKRGTIVAKNGEHSLSAQEIKLLEYFYHHQGTIISREELLNTVWGYDSNITTRTIDVHVARLRQKMGDVKDVTRYIHTIRGIGYKFTPPAN